MKKAIQKARDFVHTLSDEKLEEFSSMPIKARLQWLEEANMFVNKAIGLEKRAQFDERFEVCIPKRQKKVG
jgi:hypothetical protein